MKEYAQLTVTYDSCLATDGGEWTIAWYRPKSTTESKTKSYDDVLVELNRAGKEGWKLVDVAALNTEGGGHTSFGRDWPLTRYTFRRSAPPPVSSGQAGIPEGRNRPFSQKMGTKQGARSESGNAPGPTSTEPVTLVRFAVYCKPDSDFTDSDQRDSGSRLGTGRFFMVREVAHLHNQVDIETIESLGRMYENPDVSSGLRERIKAAVADYAATWAEGQWDTTWWQTPQSFPLSQAARLFDGSADWLCGLVEHPVADVLSVAGVEGPVVPVDAGITAGFVTAPVTAPLEAVARICEIAGIVIGLLTGAHVLVIACAKPFVHDEAKRLLGKGFEHVISSIERSLHAGPDSEIERSESSRQTEHSSETQPSQSRDMKHDIGQTPNRTRVKSSRVWPADEPSGTDYSRDSAGSVREPRQRSSGLRHDTESGPMSSPSHDTEDRISRDRRLLPEAPVSSPPVPSEPPVSAPPLRPSSGQGREIDGRWLDTPAKALDALDAKVRSSRRGPRLSPSPTEGPSPRE